VCALIRTIVLLQADTIT